MPIPRTIRVAGAAIVVVAASVTGAGAAQAGTRAPAHVSAVRHGDAVVVSWSRVSRAQAYTTRAQAADGQRLVHTAYSTDLRKWRFPLGSRYGVTVSVCAATGGSSGCEGPWRRVKLRAHQRHAHR